MSKRAEADTSLPEDDAGRAAAIKRFSREHLDRYLESGGQDGHDWWGLESLILTTAGRRSGLPRSTPLIYGRDEDRFVVVASYGGAPRHPDWYLNLRANPEVEVQVAEERFTATARTAAGAERRRLWTMMVGLIGDYEGYEERTDREIPVVVLERT